MINADALNLENLTAAAPPLSQPHTSRRDADTDAAPPAGGLRPDRRSRRLIPKPPWLGRLESRLAAKVPLHPNTLSVLKLGVAPLLLLTLQLVPASPGRTAGVLALFAAFAALDYLDGLVARGRGLATGFGRVLDRATDLPLLLGVSCCCVNILPLPLLLIKLGLDLLLMVLFVLKRGTTENRLRTTLSHAAVLGLLMLSQGWLPAVITPAGVQLLLAGNIALSSAVALNNLDLLQKRRIADLLSLGNLCCGLLAAVLAARGLLPYALTALIAGLVCDGFDGAAARRWGGSRWGVYADDVADGVSFAVAPAVALAFALGSPAGMVIAGLYGVLTAGRLVYFTLAKSSADPGYFSGVPSPVGALITMTALILFGSEPVLVGLAVGVAAFAMISFKTPYRHLGRWLAGHKRLWPQLALGLAVLVGASIAWGWVLPAAVILTGCLIYCALPIAACFAAVVAQRRAS